MGNMFSFAQNKSARAASAIGWESRYNGTMSVAVIDRVPVAGISGPWPDGNYALTWWESSEVDASPSLEFFRSMATAQRRAEDAALQIMRKM